MVVNDDEDRPVREVLRRGEVGAQPGVRDELPRGSAAKRRCRGLCRGGQQRKATGLIKELGHVAAARCHVVTTPEVHLSRHRVDERPPLRESMERDEVGGAQLHGSRSRDEAEHARDVGEGRAAPCNGRQRQLRRRDGRARQYVEVGL